MALGILSCTSTLLALSALAVTADNVFPVRLSLELLTTTVCFNRPVYLLCQYPVLPSAMFSSSRPSWREDGAVLDIDGAMYRSVIWINETELVLELVPERSHFEPSGVHNYTCFLHLVGGGELESNPLLVTPQDKPQKPGTPSSHPGIWEARIHWNRSNDQCFESQASCGLEYSISWSVSSGGSLYSATVPYPENEYTITGLRPSTEYTVTVRAQCQVDTALTSSESTVSFTTEGSRSANLSLTAINDTTCFEMPIYLQCDHPDANSNVEGNPVFTSTRVQWKKDGDFLTVDDFTYHIVQQSRHSTTLAVTYHREDFTDTTRNYSCFIAFGEGAFLESNEVQVHLNVSDANLYNLTANDEILDFSRIVACSLLVTPATIYNVTFTYALPTDNGTEMRSLNITTNQTHIDLRKVLDVNFSCDGVIGASLLILSEPDVVEFVLTSSETYACLGETYKMNCTSPERINKCGVSYPNWYKDGKLIAVNISCTKRYSNRIEELTVHIPRSYQNDSIYYCASNNRTADPTCLSNNFPVRPLRQPLQPVIQNRSISATTTTLSLMWTHNDVCFADCIKYNISWWTPHNSTLVNRTKYIVEGLQPGQMYTVKICAVCNGYPPNCTETQQYTSQPASEMTGIIIAAVVVPVLVIGVLSAVIIITIIIICCYKNKCKCSLLRTLCEKEVQQNA